jgi:hypothetical protein
MTTHSDRTITVKIQACIYLPDEALDELKEWRG